MDENLTRVRRVFGQPLEIKTRHIGKAEDGMVFSLEESTAESAITVRFSDGSGFRLRGNMARKVINDLEEHGII